MMLGKRKIIWLFDRYASATVGRRIIWLFADFASAAVQRKIFRLVAGLLAGLLAAAALWLLWPAGMPFPDDYSTLVFDSGGGLLCATLASDEQYRFPPGATGPTGATGAPGAPGASGASAASEKYRIALIRYEDKRFYRHPGVDVLALANAAVTNIKAKERIRGGSTITMQVARLADPKPRTYFNKLRECLAALRLSVHFSKEEIIQLYSAHVPMGGNIVGIQAASWVYFGKPVTELTWAEAALFVVLPNSPSMINLERERPLLVAKRNRLLVRLHQEGVLDRITLETACQEPLPRGGRGLPFAAPHFTRYVLGELPGERLITTTLDRDLQRRVEDAVSHHHAVLADQGISNLAVVVADTKSGQVRAYVGSQDFRDNAHGGQVDGAQAFRSTGSLLKPFLAAKAIDRGPYTMASMIQDVPTFYGTFAPQNATKEFSGLVSLEQSLIKSLNVPAVRLLNAYGVADFYDFLVENGLHGLFRGPDGYGLSLILGGAEATLLELTQMYASLGNMGAQRPLVTVTGGGARGSVGGRAWAGAGVVGTGAVAGAGLGVAAGTHAAGRLCSKGAAWLVLGALSQLSRPGIEHYWGSLDGQVPVAWKTGTSYGQKDAWAIGVNRQWTIGVWVGNFTGEGNASASGARSAAPLLFALFGTLTRRDAPMWFDEPYPDLVEVECCKESGYAAGPYCPETTKAKIPRHAYLRRTCPYHKPYLIDTASGQSVCSLCWNGLDTEWVTRYIVPPAAREILEDSGRRMESIPPHAAHCPKSGDDGRMELVYPLDGIKIFIPRDFDGEHERIVLSARHQRPSTHLFWYLNGSLIGETEGTHQYAVDLEPGSYRLTVQDEEGFTRTVRFIAYKKDT